MGAPRGDSQRAVWRGDPGPWKADFPWNLLWTVPSVSADSVPVWGRPRPSWSWVAGLPEDGGVFVGYMEGWELPCPGSTAEVLGVSDMMVEGSNAGSEAPGSPLPGPHHFLRIRARVCTVRISIGEQYHTRLEFGGRVLDATGCDLSAPLPPGAEDTIVLLEIFAEGSRMAGLVLAPAGMNGTYYRVGEYHTAHMCRDTDKVKASHMRKRYRKSQNASVLEAAFASCDLAEPRYIEFDGSGRYVVDVI
ncbi:hypothetical protein B0T24DRAFT_702602 [Lasiosphaeria ovina]|uniref:Uncharacterized protein n=1 Tax=Lasiosphaeria ovina TaxID=92902 RepID=A0AAE0KAP0_9PEZI|nr:hypothetical protein B0T24DRAFT_702602 [Lasiosphaeria ovina]